MKSEASAPGKLYLAGEYAVVEAGYPALIVALDRQLKVTIQSSQQGSIYSSQQDLLVTWQRQDQDIWLAAEYPYALIVTAIKAAEDYVRARGKRTDSLYQLEVESQLDDGKSGVKYGLGSSGALTVAVVKAVLAFYQLASPAYLVYQLSAISQVRLGMTGSFGDLAASSYGGLIAYHSLDRDWLKETLDHQPLLSVLDMPWQGLAIERLDLPSSLSLLIGWTGRAASTEKLVTEVNQRRNQTDQQLCHQAFLAKSRRCVERLIQACQQQEVAAFQAGISENRQLLQDFAKGMGILIETPALTHLCQLAIEEGAVAKSSGAGGGDCGICFVETAQQGQTVQRKWQQAGIVPLNLAIAKKNQ